MKHHAPILLVVMISAVLTSAGHPTRPSAASGPKDALSTFDTRNPAVVYRDAFSLGWEDWSWRSRIQLDSTQHAHASDGTVSIQAELGPWGSLSLGYPSGFHTSPYHWIEFYIYVGENTLRRLSFAFNDRSDNVLLPLVPVDDPRYIAGGAYIANRWQRVRIPLEETGGADTVIRSINIRDASGHGQWPFWVDGVRFLAATPLDAPLATRDAGNQQDIYRDVLSLGWTDWSWYSNIHFASTQHAHASDGTVSIRAELRPWGALSLHSPGFDTAPYSWLEFYIYVGDNTRRHLSVYFTDTADNELMPKVAVDDPAFIAMRAYIPNRWQRVRIPLSRTGGADTVIRRINIKDESGDVQEPFWVDGIRFVTADPEAPALGLASAGERFPGTIYDNQDQLPGASGKLRIDHPTPEAKITLSLSADGLTPHAGYVVYIDTNGTGEAAPYSFGPWLTVGSFSTDDNGHGEFRYFAPPSSYPPGLHTWTIYVNRSDHGATVLISDDFTVEIATDS